MAFRNVYDYLAMVSVYKSMLGQETCLWKLSTIVFK